MPPVWSPCQCVLSTKRHGLVRESLATAALILGVSGAYWSSTRNAPSVAHGEADVAAGARQHVDALGHLLGGDLDLAEVLLGEGGRGAAEKKHDRQRETKGARHRILLDERRRSYRQCGAPPPDCLGRTHLLKCLDGRGPEHHVLGDASVRSRCRADEAALPRASPPPPHRGEGAPAPAPGDASPSGSPAWDRRRSRSGVTFALEADDWILPMHRNLGVFTTRGVDLGRLFRQLFGKDGGFTKGRDRTFHFGLLEKRIVGMISHLGAMLPVADGLALAAQLRGERARGRHLHAAMARTSEGDFHEAVNLAAVWKLPVLFVIENNQYGLSTPVARAVRLRGPRRPRHRLRHPRRGRGRQRRAGGAWRRCAGPPRARARGDGPTLLEFKTFRMRGHEEASGTAYVPKQLFEEWARKDPVAALRGTGSSTRGLLDEATRDTLRAELKPRDRRPRGRGAGRAGSGLQRRERAGRRVRAQRVARGGAGTRSAPVSRAALRRRDPGRPARGDAAAARGDPHRPGHRGVRRRLQGDGGLRRRVRQGARPQHADHRVGRGGRRPRPRPGRLPAR